MMRIIIIIIIIDRLYHRITCYGLRLLLSSRVYRRYTVDVAESGRQIVLKNSSHFFIVHHNIIILYTYTSI